MKSSLPPHPFVNEFLAEDCTEGVRQQLLGEISIHGKSSADIDRYFTYNRFNIRLEFGKGEVSIEDDLDASEQGECRVTIAEFEALLVSHRGVRD